MSEEIKERLRTIIDGAVFTAATQHRPAVGLSVLVDNATEKALALITSLTSELTAARAEVAALKRWMEFSTAFSAEEGERG